VRSAIFRLSSSFDPVTYALLVDVMNVQAL
jgi:hypothetical protein